MKPSERPPDSSTFESLWEPTDVAPLPLDDDDDDDGLPPALSFGRKPRVSPDERETLLPPVPPGEYVKTMMALGELDDPMVEPFRHTASAPQLPEPLGLVLAAEHEMMLGASPEPEEASRATPVEPAPNTRPWAFHDSGRAGGDPPIADRPKPPRPGGAPQRGVVVPAPSRRRSTGSFPAPTSLPSLPVPRAPSAPPAPVATDTLESLDSLGDLETLDGLGSLDTIDGLGSLDSLDSLRGVHIPSHVSSSPTAPPASPVQGPPSSSTRAILPPPSSDPRDTPGNRAPVSAGLRLRTKTPVPGDDDPTPISTRVPGHDGGGARRSAELPPQTPRPEVPAQAAPPSLADLVREMTTLFEARNYLGAVVLAETVLAAAPDHAQARRCAESCREMLAQRYLTRLGGRENIPRISMSAEEMRVLSLDHRAGFLLSFVDGSMSIDEVLDVSAMPELDALRMMFELRMQGVIEIVEPTRRPGRR